MYASLNDFILALERRGELRRISYPADPNLEITEIADRVMKAHGPALLFERPKGYRFPLLINAFGSERRMAMALGAERLDDLAAEIGELTTPEVPHSLGEKVAFGIKYGRIALYVPRPAKGGGTPPCQEVVMDPPRLSELPALTCWPQDGGPFITLPLVFTHDPNTGKRNVGMYRMQVYDDVTTGMHWQLHKVGQEHMDASGSKPIEVAVCLGGDPAYTYSATAPLPKEIDEMLFAGFLRKKAVELVKCRTIDVTVPRDVDFVIEGYVDPAERRMEGPFGDHTGFYTLAEPFPVFHVTAITHRKDAVYPCTIVGPPPMEDAWLGKATERLFLPLLKTQVPEIVDMNLPPEAAFHNLAIVSIRKRYPGHARKVMHALWGLGQMMFTKIIIVVDADVNVQNAAEVVWLATGNIDPSRDVEIVMGPTDQLDHASVHPCYGGHMGIDATTKWPAEGFSREWPPIIKMDASVKSRVDAIWSKLGL
ncbi:MAG TPA: menaquinone biosynthesis decarboxylase [Armatimonadota bacterium]|jgi:4-hydroxy-3-polyprenylbenzoate decarboxylase